MRVLSFSRNLALVFLSLVLVLILSLSLELGLGLGLSVGLDLGLRLGYFRISTEKRTEDFEPPAGDGARTRYRSCEY